MNKYIYVFLLLISLVSSCSKETETIDYVDTEYYPFTENSYSIFKVDSIYHDLTDDTSIFYLKEVVKDTFVDDLGRVNKKIFRYKSKNLNSTWVLDEVWYGFKSISGVERTEYNNKTTSIVFPVRLNKQWDLNTYNDLESSIVTYQNIDQPYTVNNIIFNKTVLLDGENISNLIEYKRTYDVYGYGSGLIERERVDLEINFETGQIERGTEYYQKIVEWGIE
jgi:hypothetical protein